MNRMLYRIIFNKVRGMLMVVADITRACSGSPSCAICPRPSRLVGKISAISFSLWLATGAIQTVRASIVADLSAPGNQQPTIIQSANGTPLVNIQTPSAGGVSRNVYSQFDIDQKGAILNNANTNTSTQSVGMVAANPWLAGGQAKIILNEVNARDPSKLNGFIEVAGQKAQVIIANPSGITCDGCGFINASRATLTTGAVQMQNGSITGYRVDNGDIIISGSGLDSSRQEHTDIIARAVKINAALHAKDLNITTGRNQVDPLHQQITALEENGGATPQFSLDVSQLGGMYAGKIRLRGTENGVGVHNAGNINAAAGDVAIDANGILGNSGSITASENLRLDSQGQLDNSGKLYAAANTAITVAGMLSNNGMIAAGNDTSLSAASVVSSSAAALGAGINSDGTPGAAGNLTVTSQQAVGIRGQAIAAGDLAVTGTALDLSGSQTVGNSILLQADAGSVNTTKATVVATRQLTVSARDTIGNDGGILQAEKLTLNARALSSQQGQIRQSGTDDLQLSFADGLNNTGGEIASNGRNLTLDTSVFSHQQGSLLHTGNGELNISGKAIDSMAGLLLSKGRLHLNAGALVLDDAVVQAEQLSVTADSLSHRRGNTLQTGNGDLSLTIGGILDNQQGQIAANGNILLTAAGLNNQQGKLIAEQSGALRVKTQQRLNNQQGVMAAAGDLSLHGNGLNNAAGLLQSGADMALAVSHGSLDNRDSGSDGGIVSKGSLAIEGGNADNTDGFIAAVGEASLNLQNLTNQRGTLAGDAGLSLTTGAVDNRSGLVQAATHLSLNTQGNTLTNSGGLFSAGQTLRLLTGVLLNSSGRVISAGTLYLSTQQQLLDNSGGTLSVSGEAQLDSGTLLNVGGQIQIVGDARIDTGGATLDNTAGLIRGGESLSLTAALLNNRDTLSDNRGIEGQSVTLTSASVDNAGGAIRANDPLSISSSTLNNSGGLISSAARLDVHGGNALTFTNTAGTLIGGSALNLSAYSLSGDGRVLSQDAMRLALQQTFFNQGDVIANGDMHFTTAGELVNQARISAGGELNLYATALDNQHQADISAGENHLWITGSLTNRGLIDGGLTHISSSVLTNTGTGRIYGDRVALQTTTLNNLAENGTAATIAARQRLDIGAGVINNIGHGLLYSTGDIAIGGTLDASWQASDSASVFNNHSATLESGGNMTLNIGEINNINDHLVTEEVVVEQSYHHEAVLKGHTTRFNWDDIDFSYKNKYGVRDAIMPDGTRDNTFYEYRYQRTITETQVTESDPGQIMAGENLTINSHRLNNHDSRIVAGGLLGGIIGELNNIATLGKRVIADIGTQVRWYAKKSSNNGGGTTTSQGKDSSKYTPADVIQTVDLQTLVWQENAPLSGGETTITDRRVSGTEAIIIAAGTVTADTGQTPVTPPSGQLVQLVLPDNDGDTVIKMIVPDTRLPDSSLYLVHPASDATFLIETDPRFTDKKQWLGSDYMQDRFTQDPNNVLKRLGDGFYEQQLIRQQVVALTGNRYLSGYDSDEAQFLALMQSGVAFGKDYNLTLGVALSAEQMALLTSDMIWLVKQTVTLPDGTTQEVLVPQLYARVKADAPDGSGALLAGNSVALSVSQDLTNSGHISGREVTQLTADNLNNSGFIAGDTVDIRARTDINNIGGTLLGNSSLLAMAGRDINSTSTLSGSPASLTLDRPAGIYVQNDNGTLDLRAINNISLTATQLSNAGEGGQTRIIAGNDLNLNTVTTTHSESARWGKGNDRTLTQRSETGTQITANGDILLSAGHDLNARAVTVSAADALTVTAGNDINILSGDASYHLTENSHQSSSGLLSKKSVTTHDEVQSHYAISSHFDGDSVMMQAGHDLNLTAGNVAGTNNVALAAGNNLTIGTAEETLLENHRRRETKSGLSGTGGIGVTLGSSALKITDEGATHSSLGSTVGSAQGNLSLSAGNSLTVKGADLLAGRDLSLTGSEVNILAAENHSSQTHTVEQKQSGITLALSGTVGSSINAAVTTANEAGNESNDRLAALKGIKAALTGVQAYQGAQLAEAGGSEGSMAGVNLSWGSQSSTSSQTATRTQHEGSTLTAGNNLTINATGTDINVQGSQIQAGNDASLSAARDVNLVSSEDSHTLDGKNESHGSSVGVGINFGQGANGLSLNASANKGKGAETGNGNSHVETTVNAGNHLTLSSGRDTTLTGAQVGGEKVTMDVGRNLTLTSQQDSDNYDAKQQSTGAGGSLSTTVVNASLNLSRDSMHSTYASVQEQTGIFAGAGGFAVSVGEHTQLSGAVIGSTATAEKNKLDTGTLGFSDIHNRAEYEVEHQSVGISTGGSVGAQFESNLMSNVLAGVSGSDSAASTTRSAVSDGTITVRDREKQQHDVAELSRDVEGANPGLAVIFDKEKEQQRLKAAQLIAEIGGKAMDIARTEGQIAGEKAKKDPAALQAAREQLAGQGNLNPTADQIAEQAYNTAMAPFGTGSALQQGLQAATAAIQGLAGGNIGQAISGAAAPYIAGIIGSSGLDDAGKVLAHAAVNAALAAAQGNSALVGAAGAATAEMAGMIALEVYGKSAGELSETEKQTVSALATLAAGLAGGLTGDSTADTVAAAQAGKTTVTNNLLGATSSDKLDKAVEKIRQGDKSLAAANELIKLENADKRSDALVDKFTRDPSQMSSTEQAELAGYLRVYASEMEKEYGAAVSQELVKGLLSGQDYIKRNPDSEAMASAQQILNTWGYHKSNASIGDSALIFGSSVLGTTIKEGMALNAAIGVGVNTVSQLSGNDPFSYVDAIMAGVTAAATTGKGILPSAGINMGGAAIGSGIKGEDPTNSVIGAGFGSAAGSIGGKVITDKAAGIVKDTTADLTGAAGGSIISEVFGNGTKELLDQAGEKDEKK
ncbi:filamentous hemagglutinin N-terminal domain-containing protein [Erwinia psidii]|nr:filamentous hemagglutinin N-terminal domain-containing protein [Erwinia psidii]